MSEATTPSAAIYRGYTQSELDAQYDQKTLVPNDEEYRRHNVVETERVRAALGAKLDVRYGTHEDQRLDLYSAKCPNAPAVVYMHGGAWKGGDKREAGFIAEPLVANGVTFLGVNFALVPKVSLGEQVGQAVEAVAWTYRNAAQLGVDTDRIFVAGHSSGAHLAGMAMATDWEAAFGLPGDLLKGAALFSGIYDLEPVRLSWRDSYLHLGSADVAALSPIRAIAARTAPLIVGCGTGELGEFQRQSAEFDAHCRRLGYACRWVGLPGYNHFDVLRTFADAKGAIVSALLERILR